MKHYVCVCCVHRLYKFCISLCVFLYLNMCFMHIFMCFMSVCLCVYIDLGYKAPNIQFALLSGV